MLPRLVRVIDYHEFDCVQDNMRLLLPTIKVKEIGFDGFEYIGIAYTGNLKDKANRHMIYKIKQLTDEAGV